MRIFLILFLFFISVNVAHAQTIPAPAIVKIAQSEIGNGEMGGNNKGYYVRQYLNGRENLPWCAGFISYCAKKAGYKLPYTLQAKDFMRLGRVVKTPQVGDLIIFSRQGGGHIGVIESINKDKIISIEGNLGEYPAKVKRVVHNRHNLKNLLGFVRLTQQGK